MNKKHAFVSGSTQGIGYHIAETLIKENYIVFINGRSEKKTKEICSKLGKNAKPFIYDLTNYQNLKETINKLIPPIKFDLVISNIGTGSYSNEAFITIDNWIDCFHINFFQAINLINHLSKHLNPNQSQIIAITSIAGCEDIGAPTPYQAAKAALLMTMKTLSRKLASKNIRVNCISPGNVLSKDGLWDKKLKEDKAKTEKYIHEHVPLNIFVDPNDISKTVLYLENNKSITGSNIIVDAGQVKKI